MAYNKAWYDNNKAHVKKYLKEYYNRNAEKKKTYQRAADLKRNYDLTVEQWDALVASQNGRCKICMETPTGKLVVDHDHRSGLRRGLICRPCNVMLGMARDKVEILRAGAAYLEAN